MDPGYPIGVGNHTNGFFSARSPAELKAVDRKNPGNKLVR